MLDCDSIDYGELAFAKFLIDNLPKKEKCNNEIFTRYIEYNKYHKKNKWFDKLLLIKEFVPKDINIFVTFTDFYKSRDKTFQSFNDFNEFKDIFYNIERKIIEIGEFYEKLKNLNELLNEFNYQYDPDLMDFKPGKIFYDAVKHDILLRESSSYPNKSIISLNLIGIVSRNSPNKVIRKSLVNVCIK